MKCTILTPEMHDRTKQTHGNFILEGREDKSEHDYIFCVVIVDIMKKTKAEKCVAGHHHILYHHYTADLHLKDNLLSLLIQRLSSQSEIKVEKRIHK